MNKFFKSRSWWWVATALGAIIITGTSASTEDRIMFYFIALIVPPLVILITPHEKIIAAFLSAQFAIIYQILCAIAIPDDRYSALIITFSYINTVLLIFYLFILYWLCREFGVKKELLLFKGT